MAQSAAEHSSAEPVAVVSGIPITEEELATVVQPQLRQLRQQEYTFKSQALESLIDQKLAAAAAQKRGVTVPELLRQEIESKTPPVTDTEIEAFYEGQKANINQPLEAVKEQVRKLLFDARGQQVRQAFLKNLRESAEVSIYLVAPRTEVTADPERSLGNPTAPVTIVEFSDFECPYCQRAHAIIRSVVEKYGDQVSFSYRDFPLRGAHSRAQMAAEASRCAVEQGRFWDYHDSLFERPNKLSKDELIEHAILLELNAVEFQACLESGRHTAAVERDVQAGGAAGVTGTPAFFINGILISGAQSAAVFEKTIDSELASHKKAAAAR